MEDLFDSGYCNVSTSPAMQIVGHPAIAALKTPSILEIGCNAGRNLECFRRNGYEKLSGIELSPSAVKLMRIAFPELVELANIHVGYVQDAPCDTQYDLVYSAAVLQHIDARWETAREKIAAMCGRFLVMIEVVREQGCHTGQTMKFRDYTKEFEPYGFRQLEFHDEAWVREHLSEPYNGYSMWVLEKNPS